MHIKLPTSNRLIGVVNVNMGSVRRRIVGIVTKYTLVALGVICFPWAITLLLSGENENKVYKATKGDYFVVAEGKKIGLEDFVAFALVKQMDMGEHEEALKAQAVILRTYIYEKMSEGKSKKVDVDKLDLPYVTYGELEDIWGDEFPEKYNKLMKVIEATSGKVIMYEGKAIKPYYHNTSCGYTRDGVTTFGEGYNYLVSVQSVGDVESEDYQGSVILTKEEFVKILRESKKDMALSVEKPLETLQIIDRDKGGYILKLQIGNVTMLGDEFAAIFKLRSPNFQVEESDGNIHIITKGVGHGIGLSTYGAKILAKNGKSYTEILQHYYSEVYLEPLWEE